MFKRLLFLLHYIAGHSYLKILKGRRLGTSCKRGPRQLQDILLTMSLQGAILRLGLGVKRSLRYHGYHTGSHVTTGYHVQRKMDMVSVEHCLIHDLLLEFSVEFSSGTTSRLGGRLWKVPFDRAVTALEVDMPTASASNYWVLNLFLSVSVCFCLFLCQVYGLLVSGKAVKAADQEGNWL